MSKTKSTRSPTRPDRYLEFIKTVHLSGFGLDEASYQVDREALSDSRDKSENLTPYLEGGQDLSNVSAGSFLLLGRYKVELRASSGKVAMTLSCVYSALFNLDKEADIEFLKRFASNEGRLIFWPYLRQLISDATTRMSISPLILPLTSEMN